MKLLFVFVCLFFSLFVCFQKRHKGIRLAIEKRSSVSFIDRGRSKRFKLWSMN